MTELFWLLPLGLFMGLSSSFLGLGGGFLMVPLLTSFSHLSQHEIIATSLITVCLISSNNALAFALKKQILWKKVFLLGLFSVLGALVGSYGALLMTEGVLKILLIGVLGVLILKSFLPSLGISRGRFSSFENLLALGFGLISGLTGLGGGVFFVFLLLHASDMPVEKVSPTANVLTALIGFFGSLAFLPSKAVQWEWAFILFGMAFGVSLWARPRQHRLSERLRKRILGWILVSLFISLVIS